LVGAWTIDHYVNDVSLNQTTNQPTNQPTSRFHSLQAVIILAIKILILPALQLACTKLLRCSTTTAMSMVCAPHIISFMSHCVCTSSDMSLW
jgi:hypothetical protein